MRRYSLDKEGNIKLLKKEVEPRLLPKLYTDGSQIKRADTGEVVELKGLNVAIFALEGGLSFEHLLDHGLRKVVDEKWQINLLRVSLDSKKMDRNKLREIDLLVDYAEINGIYILFNPHQVGDNEGNDWLPNQSITDMMGELAKRYELRNNILYQIWNEPQPHNYLGYENYYDEWKLWLERAKPVAESIRTNNPESIVVVPGGRFWARDLSWYLQHPFEVKGNSQKILYDVHDYGDLTNPETNIIYPSTLPDQPRNLPHTIALSRAYAKKFMDDGIAPVLFGEFDGSKGNSDEEKELLNSDRDLRYIIHMFNLINTNDGKGHYSFWSVEENTGFGLFTNGDYNTLSFRGYLIYYDLTGKFHPKTPDHIKDLIANSQTQYRLPSAFIE